EFYRVFAYFNNVPERGRAIKYGNSPPMIPAPTPDQQARLAGLERRLAKAEAEFAALRPVLSARQAEWEPTVSPSEAAERSATRALLAHLPLDGDATTCCGAGGTPTAPGRIGRAADLDGSAFVDAGDVGHFGFYDKFTLAAWVLPADGRGGPILSRMKPTD